MIVVRPNMNNTHQLLSIRQIDKRNLIRIGRRRRRSHDSNFTVELLSYVKNKNLSVSMLIKCSIFYFLFLFIFLNNQFFYIFGQNLALNFLRISKRSLFLCIIFNENKVQSCTTEYSFESNAESEWRSRLKLIV